jgi:DNA-directed RNA polymerase subunit RPC12/RpoP
MELCFAKTLYNCPNCESRAIRRSTREGFVERVFLRATLVWPYRCDDCDTRFWGFRRQVPAAADQRDLQAA